jgi:Tfp pilus assembly protein PilV
LKSKNNKKDKGSTLVEALISVAIIAFVMVSILSAFSQQQLNTRNNADKNSAIILAEERMEELLKFPSGQLAEETYQDYIVFKDNKFKYYDTDPKMPNQFRRTTTISKDLMQQLATIQVMVEFGKRDNPRPPKVVISTKRGLK